MGKQAKRAIVGILLCVTICFALYLFGLIPMLSHFVSSNGTEIEASSGETKEFHTQETICLYVPAENEKDEDALAAAFGKYGFPWTGTLKLTVCQTSFYEQAKDSGLDFPDEATGKDALLVLDVHIENEDATSHLTTRDNESWFNITSIFNRNIVEYFDGMPKEGDSQTDYYFFDLRQGESADYRVGIYVGEEGAPQILSLGARGLWQIEVE